jgi:hypothetical protein
VRVVAERAARRGRAGALEPARRILAGALVGWPQQRGHREPTRPPLLQACERAPDRIVERTLDVAGDDRVPFRRRADHGPKL